MEKESGQPAWLSQTLEQLWFCILKVQSIDSDSVCFPNILLQGLNQAVYAGKPSPTVHPYEQ